MNTLTWVLILTMSSSDSKFIDHIDGFDRDACGVAGNLWLEQHPSNGFHQFTATCVNKTSGSATEKGK